MSRNEKKIRDALKAIGSKRRHKIHWEPIHGPCMEMCGYAGGWFIDDFPVGYSTEQVVKFIAECPNAFRRRDEIHAAV